MTTNTTHTEINTGETGESTPPDSTETITRLSAEIGELTGRLRASDARETMVRSLAAAGARSPELLFGSVRERLQFDADGGLVNTAALVDLLRRELPEQFRGAGSIDAASGSAAGQRPLSKEALAKMSPAQISKLDWNAVRAVLSQS